MSQCPTTAPAKPAAGGRALVVAHADAHEDAQRLLAAAGLEAEAVLNPYEAMLELLRRPMVYRALVVSLPGLFRRELPVIAAVARHLPHVARFVCHADGRAAALAEAMRLGATGVLDDEGLHELTSTHAPPEHKASKSEDMDSARISADELRALLSDS